MCNNRNRTPSFAPLVLGLVMLSGVGFASAQGVPASAAQPTPAASIGEITALARKVRIAELEKQLRDAQKPTDEAPPAVSLAIPPLPSGQPPVPAIDGMGTPQMPLPVPAMVPEIPAPPSVRGIVMIDGRPPRAQLAIGGEIGVGDRVGAWTVTSISERNVAWERCDRASSKRKARTKPATECHTDISTPSS